MSRLTRELHPRTTTTTTSSAKSWTSASSSVAAQLLLRRVGSNASNGDSLEFFSDLRKRNPDPDASRPTGQAQGRRAEGRNTARRGGGAGELLSPETGKHDYDWLLTPPATPLWSRSTSPVGNPASAATPSRLARARSTSHTKSNSRVSERVQQGPGGRENESLTSSRLARSSSARPSVVNTPEIASPGHVSHVRTLSSASASSINSTASKVSGSSTPSGSTTASPRAPGTARSAWTTARPRGRSNAGKQAMGSVPAKSGASYKSSTGRPAPASPVAHATSSTLSPRSTTSTSRQPAPARRAEVAVARSWLAKSSSTAGSTAQAASPRAPQSRDVHHTKGAPISASSPRSGIKTPQAPAAVTRSGFAAASATTQRWQRALAPVVSASRNARREDTLSNGSPRSGRGRKISAEKATPHRATVPAVGLTRSASQKLATTVKANGKDDRRSQAAVHGGAPTHKALTPATHQQSCRPAVPRTKSRLGLMAAASGSEAPGSVTGGLSTSENGRGAAVHATTARIGDGYAFPSTRYDAMLLREDPKNLTWLRGSDDGDDSSGGGLDLVDGSLEPPDVPSWLRGTAARI